MPSLGNKVILSKGSVDAGQYGRPCAIQYDNSRDDTKGLPQKNKPERPFISERWYKDLKHFFHPHHFHFFEFIS